MRTRQLVRRCSIVTSSPLIRRSTAIPTPLSLRATVLARLAFAAVCSVALTHVAQGEQHYGPSLCFVNRDSFFSCAGYWAFIFLFFLFDDCGYHCFPSSPCTAQRALKVFSLLANRTVATRGGFYVSIFAYNKVLSVLWICGKVLYDSIINTIFDNFCQCNI